MTEQMTNQEIADVFEACIPLIESGETTFICHAIYEHVYGKEWGGVWADVHRLEKPKHPCHSIVDSAINGSISLAFVAYEMFPEQWEHRYYDENWNDPKFRVQCLMRERQWRIDWLKSLVLEYRNKS